MADTIEQLKQEVASEYLKKYKKEIGRLKSLALYPLEKEVKNILSGNAILPEKFDEIQEFGWRGKVLGFISRDMASDLLSFMKEKRLEIENAKTTSELVELKSEILEEKKPEKQKETSDETETSSGNGTPLAENSEENPPISSDSSIPDENENEQAEQEKGQRSAKAGIATTSGIAGAGIIDNIRESRSAKKAVREMGKEHMNEVANLTRDKILKLNEEAKKSLNAAKNNPRLTERQIRNIDKAIEKFDKQMGKIGDDAMDVYNAYMKLGERMPKKVLQGIEMLDPKNAKKITSIADQLVGKNVDEMKAILHSHKITGVSDDAVEALVKMGNKTDDFLAMAKVLSAPAKAKNVFHLVKSAFIIDIACLGFDIRMFTETLNEADLIEKVNTLRAQNKRNQAWAQLAIGVASFALELGIIITAASIGSTAGPIGTVVGLAVGAITAAASMGVDALYFDVQDFYKQNKEDYIRQPRAQLKQAILQHLHNKKEGNVSLNEKLGSPDKVQKEKTLKEAWESICFLEAVNDEKTQSDFSLLLEYKFSGQSEQEFLGSRDAETHTKFGEQKEKLNKMIALRIEYIEKSLGEDTIIAGLKSSQGMYYLSKLLTESAFYAERKQAGKWEDKTYDENVQAARQELLAEIQIPADIKTNLDAITQKDKHFLYELYYGAKLYTKIVDDQHLQQNFRYLENYMKAREIGNIREKQYRIEFFYGDLNYNYIEAVLEYNFETTGFAYNNFTSADIKGIAYYRQERNLAQKENIVPVSDKISQNIIYRLATEFYGYTGKNEAMALMQYYSEGEGHVHGLYYKDGRYINNDRAIDQKFDLTYLDDKTLSEKEVATYVEHIVKSILYENAATINPAMVSGALIGMGNILAVRPRKSMIDTPTEAIDTYLNDEFETRFRAILQEELGAKTTEKKEELKKQISDFIREFSKEGGYVELPYYLVIAAKRAGLGDLEKTQFSLKKGKIVAVGQVHDLRAIGDLEVEKEYVEQVRNTFTPEELQYIDLVETAHKQVEELRSIEGRGSREDELDFPVEIEHDISQQYKDWNTLKGRLLCYEPSVAQSKLLEEYKTYYEYFNALYLGILLSLNSFNWSNDIDTMSYFQQALYHGNKELFDEKGALRKDKKGKLEIEGKGVEEFYNQQLGTQKYNEKTIQELRTSENEQEKKFAKRYSTQILTAMMESYLLNWNKKGKLSGFRHSWNGTTKGEMSLSLNDTTFLQKFSLHLQNRIAHNPFTLPDLEPLAQIKTADELQIRSYAERDKKSESLSKAIQKKVEQTLPNVEWQGKRGDVTFNPEDSTLESRGQKSKVAFEGENKIRISGFSRALDIESGIWLLNFINWKKYQYPNQHISHEREWSRATWWNPREKGLVVNGTMIIADTTLKSFINNLTSEEIDEIAIVLQ